MKFLVLALLVAAAVAAPTPDDSQAVEMIVNGVPQGEPLELGDIVDITLNKHVDGELASATNLLHPLTAVGIAEAAVAAEATLVPEPVILPEVPTPEVVGSVPEAVVLPEAPAPEVILPVPIVLPEAPTPEVIVPAPILLPDAPTPVIDPEPVVLPEAPAPEVVLPAPIVLPSPASPEVVPAPIVLPSPGAPEVVAAPEAQPVAVVEQPEVIPTPVAQLPNGEVYNDGLVQVSVNAPEDPGMMATLQTWFNMVLNYFNNGVQTSQQII